MLIPEKTYIQAWHISILELTKYLHICFLGVPQAVTLEEF